jgi:hypothetical protein
MTIPQNQGGLKSPPNIPTLIHLIILGQWSIPKVILHIVSLKTKNDMTKQNSTSGLLFGMTILVGLMPLAFTFSQNGTELLLDTSFKYIVWGGQATHFLLLLLIKQKLSKNQLIALTVLFILVPFTFSFNEKGATFLILTKYISSILSWAIASIVFTKLFFTYKFNEDSNI